MSVVGEAVLTIYKVKVVSSVPQAPALISVDFLWALKNFSIHLSITRAHTNILNMMLNLLP